MQGAQFSLRVVMLLKFLEGNLSLTTENLVQNNLITRTKIEGIEEEREKNKDRN
jgi:hypothetical protein